MIHCTLPCDEWFWAVNRQTGSYGEDPSKFLFADNSGLTARNAFSTECGGHWIERDLRLILVEVFDKHDVAAVVV